MRTDYRLMLTNAARGPVSDRPGFFDQKNELNIARWRMRWALNQGRDLPAFRPATRRYPSCE
jgi:hypothetical protein